MRKKPLLLVLVAAFAIVGTGVLVFRWEASGPPKDCQICGRVIPKETAFHMHTTGGTIDSCCPSCAMHYMLHHPGTVSKALATDFGSGRMIPASSAYYDEGGDVQYCTRHRPPVERGPDGVSQRVYDRCLPVLVAFANKDEAEAYRQKHGGQILTYDQALALVRSQ